MRSHWFAAATATLLVAGCGETSVPLLQGPPSASLLTIDQLVAPDFNVDIAPHVLTVSDVVATAGGAAQTLQANGFRSAAGEEFFRNVGQLNDVNGPVQIRDTIESFSAIGGATAVFGADVHRLDAVVGSSALSTGALGDQSHAVQRTADAGGVLAVEITVEWRVQNTVNVLVVRGRFGGTRLDDALLLAHAQTANELGLTTPAPAPAHSAQPPPATPTTAR